MDELTNSFMQVSSDLSIVDLDALSLLEESDGLKFKQSSKNINIYDIK
jgi:hypothetical protein